MTHQNDPLFPERAFRAIGYLITGAVLGWLLLCLAVNLPGALETISDLLGI